VSGHSKWSSIKHKKGAADAKRGKLFSKLSRAIIVAAKDGGGDPANNLSLQNAIEKAKSYSMPKDNIDRAIAKGSGADADADAFETIVYEGYGPEGVAVIVEALTDNKNRTAADVRHMF
jgi:YebC/PmpR family DNA-binding regulatory protein